MNIWHHIGQEIADFTTQIPSLPVSRQRSPRDVREQLEASFDFTIPVPLSELTQRVADFLKANTVQVTHPRYFGLFNPSVSESGIVADTLAALYNPQLATWSHAPAANELERFRLRYLARSLGLDPDTTFANFTSGGLEANMSAVLVALARRSPRWAEEGLRGLEPTPVNYLTGESHHSFLKIVRTTGLGANALCEVPTTADFRFDVSSLRQQPRTDASGGRCPLMIVGTAGTTGGGTVDPLMSLADVAEESGAWFHVDAAWGGAAAMVPRLRPALSGIERADSVTWDAHKWLSVPMSAGMFFCSHPEAVRRAFDVSTSYMPAGAGAATTDPYMTTVQWSRAAWRSERRPLSAWPGRARDREV